MSESSSIPNNRNEIFNENAWSNDNIPLPTDTSSSVKKEEEIIKNNGDNNNVIGQQDNNYNYPLPPVHETLTTACSRTNDDDDEDDNCRNQNNNDNAVYNGENSENQLRLKIEEKKNHNELSSSLSMTTMQQNDKFQDNLSSCLSSSSSKMIDTNTAAATSNTPSSTLTSTMTFTKYDDHNDNSQPKIKYPIDKNNIIIATSTKTISSSSSLLDSVIEEEEQEQQQKQIQNNQHSSQRHNHNQPTIAKIDDNETNVATHMAAVAALVTAATREHKIGNSPSVAATYVKDLMAGSNMLNQNNNYNANSNNSNNTYGTSTSSSSPSIHTSGTIVPGMKRSTGSDKENAKSSSSTSSSSALKNNKKSNSTITTIPVHLHLVTQYLKGEIVNDIHDKQQQQQQEEERGEVTELQEMKNRLFENNQCLEDSETLGPIHDSNSKQVTIKDETNNLVMNKFTKSTGTSSTSSSKEVAPSMNKINTKQNASITLLNQVQNGDNINFLKQLLILTSHTCIDSNQHELKHQQQHQQKNDKDDLKQNDGNSATTVITDIDKKRAKNAVAKVIQLIEQVDSSFDFLLRHLPSIPSSCAGHNNNSHESLVSTRIEASKIMKEDDDSNVGLEDYDPTTTFHQQLEEYCEDNKEDTVDDNRNKAEISTLQNDSNNIGRSENATDNKTDIEYPSSSLNVHSVIPDLLPLCMPDEGDVTNYFFRACEAVMPTPQSPTSSLPTQIDKDETIMSDTDTITTSLSESSSSVTLTRNHAASMFSSVLSTVKTAGIVKGRRIRNKTKNVSNEDAVGGGKKESTKSSSNVDTKVSQKNTEVGTDYKVVIESEMLGLTVENVLERTVVRTVLAQGAAKKAGTKIGSLIVKVGSVATTNFTHFETIDELRQSKRPLTLVLRKISKEALKGAREEMGRLIKGGGFGNSIGDTGIVKNNNYNDSDDNQADLNKQSRDTIESRNTIQTYTLHQNSFNIFLQSRWIDGAKLNTTSKAFTKKEETVSKAGSKLAWILCLLVVGMEREAEMMKRNQKSTCDDSSKKGQSHYSADDYIEAAKSVSKVLHDYVQNHFTKGTKIVSPVVSQPMAKKRAKQMPPAHIQDRQRNAVPGASRRNPQQSLLQSSPSSSTETALLKIGDVLHRTRSFLADPHSPPAALLRGEVIALLCDVLDLDTDMVLSEQEGASATTGRKGGAINDLGSAGSLLKLIVLNCSVMRSVGCVDKDNNCHSLHAGNRFLAVVHRLAASRSSSARVTACALGPVMWGHLDFPHQLQLRGVITRALHDSDVVVRKSTAIVLHEIAELVFDSRAVPWLVLMCERAMTDPEPQLRAAAMTLTFHLAEHLPNAFFGDAREGSRSRRRLPSRTDPAFAEVYLLQCKLLPVATRLAEDVSAPVRLAVAAQCDRLANALGRHWYSVIIDLLQALLGDQDESVRAEAALCIPRLAEIVIVDNSNGSGSNVTVLESLLPLAIKLHKDTSIDVRSALATAAGEMLTLLVGFQSCEEISVFEASPVSKEKERSAYKKHIDDTLIPLLQRLLQDSNPEVTSSALRAITNTSRGNVREISSRRNEEDSISLSSSHQSHVIEKKDPVFIPVLSEEQVLRLVPTLSKLAKSGQWRVRQSAVEIVPALLSCTQKLEIRTEIAQLCVTLMSDSVDAVRRTAAECLCLGGNSVGGDSQEWIQTVVLPHVEACRDNPKSKQRLLSLKMVEVILTQGLCYSGKKIVEHIVNPTNDEEINISASLIRRSLEVLESLSRDETVNVRLNVGRIIYNIIGILEEDDLNFVMSILDGQIETEQSRPLRSDRDVIFFAKRAKKLAFERLKMLRNL